MLNRWCSHVYFMVYDGDECWCQVEDCGARWRLTWKATPDGGKVPTAWVICE